MESLEYIKELLEEEGKIKEESYKQRVFENFFKELGYKMKEVKFEKYLKGKVYDTPKFADVICGDILLEVKSSNKSLNEDVIRQAFSYNQSVGADIIGVTNFKKFEFYKRSVNNQILKFDIENYRDHLHDIYRILGKYTYLTIDEYVEFSENIEKLNYIIKELKDYLMEYEDNDYNILPYNKVDDNFLFGIKSSLSRYNRRNNTSNEKLEKLKKDLFYKCQNLLELQANYYSPDKDEYRIDILNITQTWKRSHKKEMEKLEDIAEDIVDLGDKIKNLIENIKDANDKIYSLKQYYEDEDEDEDYF